MKNTTAKPMTRKFCALALLSLAAGAGAFAPTSLRTTRSFAGGIQFSAATDDEILSMRAGAIKKELESYGVSTVGLLEKSELVEALRKARASGPPPAGASAEAAPASEKKKKKKRRAASDDNDDADDGLDREAKIQAQIEELKSLRVSQLQQELKSRGVSTVGLLEKSELVQALAEAKVDGVAASGGGVGDSYAEYSNVEVITDDSAGPRPKQSEGSSGGSAGAGAGASPFGNLEDMMGGMGGGMPGGMGGMADILKNMGGMGGMGGGAPGGASPFGGGGNPFGGGMPGGMGGMGGMGDMMGKAQEMMKNPKVMELMMKAQQNPKVMAAMQECMSNPAAINKYRNDPEVAELIKELEKVM